MLRNLGSEKLQHLLLKTSASFMEILYKKLLLSDKNLSKA